MKTLMLIPATVALVALSYDSSPAQAQCGGHEDCDDCWHAQFEEEWIHSHDDPGGIHWGCVASTLEQEIWSGYYWDRCGEAHAPCCCSELPEPETLTAMIARFDVAGLKTLLMRAPHLVTMHPASALLEIETCAKRVPLQLPMNRRLALALEQARPVSLE